MTTPKSQGVSSCLSYDPVPDASPTVQRFRSNTNPAPGQQTLMFNAPTLNSNATFGKKSSLTPASELINPKPISKFQMANDAVKLPNNLKKTMSKAPSITQDMTLQVDAGPTFGDRKRNTKRHFAESYTNDGQSKEVLKPEVDESIDQEAIRTTQYVKSHGAYLPGERVTRQYNNTFNKDQLMGKGNRNGPKAVVMGKTLQWRSWNANTTEFISDRQKAMQQRKELKSSSGQIPEGVAEDFIFGRPSEERIDTVATLLETKRGDDDDSDEMDGTRTDAYSMSRSAGVNTIRKDIKVPALVRVTDTKNYGDQNVSAVLTPSKLTQHGANVSHVTAKRSKDELQFIFENAGLAGTVDFDQVWNSASNDGENLVSVEEFQQAL